MSATSPGVQPSAAPAPRTRRTWGQRFALLFGVLATVGTLLAAGVLNWGVQRFEAIEEVEVASVERAPSGEPANWLLVGTDTRDGISEDDPNAAVFVGEPVSGKRTDTIIVARIDPAIGSIDLLSVPRDLWVTVADTGTEARINTSFVGEGGGPDRLVKTVEQTLNIEINHYLEVNFVGFQAIVDAMGGVPLYFDKPMRDSGSGLDIPTAGCHLLDGFDALAFARARQLQYLEDGEWRSDGTGDIGRSTRQQYFLRQVGARAAGELDVTSLSTVDDVLTAGGENLLRDQSVTPADFFDLARVFRNVPSEQIRSHSLATEGFRTGGGADVLRFLPGPSDEALSVFRGDRLEPVAEGAFSLKVLNGSGVNGQAGQAADAFIAEGFNVVEVGDAAGVTATVVRYGEGAEQAAERVARQLIVTPVLEPVPGLDGVEVVTGPDWEGLRIAPAELGTITAPPVEGESSATPTTVAEQAASSETTSIAADPSTTTTAAQPGVVPQTIPGEECG